MKPNTTQSGFTLVETIVAILILILTVGALLTLTAGGFFTIRYIKNDIAATNLLQESLEYIRNTRDTAAQSGIPWEEWSQTYINNGCTSKNGCIVNPYAIKPEVRVVACDNDCPYMTFFPGPNFYSYPVDNIFGPSIDQPYETSFVRTIRMQVVDSQTTDTRPTLAITASIQWMNGTNRKSVTQSLTLTPWNL